MANDISNFGLYIPTTYVLDVAQLQQIDVKSDEFKELIVRLYQTINSIILSLNMKDSGYYLTQEFVTGALFFDPSNDFTNLRPVYRTVVNFGPLPAAGFISKPHNIPNIVVAGATTFSFTKIYGVASKQTVPVSFIPIPYVSATAIANQLQLDVDATNVTITTGGTDYSAYTVCYVVLEYLKN